MYTLSSAQKALAAVDLHQGLPTNEVHGHLQQGVRLNETGQRIMAFYLTEMEDRGLHQETGHSSTAFFAEARLGLDRRRTGELISVGRTLLTLPAIDQAFCAQRIGWAKVLQLVKVASSEHDDAWLERALKLTCRELALEIRLAKPGSAPRKPGERKGLPEIRFQVRASIGVLAHQKWDLAKKKLAAERGTSVSDGECLDILSELFLNLEEDGSVAGRTRVDSSLYRIILHPDGGGDGDGDGGGLVVDTDAGRMPLDTEIAALRCDAECVDCSDDGRGGSARKVKDQPTSKRMRQRVIQRDGGACTCCGSRHRLMVHHIQFRSEGGPTQVWNLITLCVSCHALVHAALLCLVGERAEAIRFVDADGSPLHAAGKHAPTAALAALEALSAPVGDPATGAGVVPSPEPLGFDTLPQVVDGAWWHRHAALIQFRGPSGIEFRPGRPLGEVPADPRCGDEVPDAVSATRAFADIVGQDALLHRLAVAGRGSCSRGRPFPHTLFYGPPGTGKTTLARGIAKQAGARLVQTTGPMMQETRYLVALLGSLRAGDMLFLDEIHAVPQPVLEVLYQALAEGHLTFTVQMGARSRALRLDLPAFTLLAATTEEGDLPEALRSRFGLQESLGFYTPEALAALARHVAHKEGFKLKPRGAVRLALSARGTPREVIRLLDRVMDEAASRDERTVGRGRVGAALEALGYDAEGLNPGEQRYLAVLRTSAGPVSLQRLAQMLGSSVRSILMNVEPNLFRRGLVRVTERGRMAAHPPRLLEA